LQGSATLIAKDIKRRILAATELTASAGVSYNKFLAKIASDLDKPRGFAVIGEGDAQTFLGPKPVSLIWGVGKALQARLAADGITTVANLRERDEVALVARYGAIGRRLHRFSRGLDERRVDPDGEIKSISAETTFDEDIAEASLLAAELWPLCEKVSRRMKRNELAGHSVHLKLKTADFKTLTRSKRLPRPTQLAEVIYQAAAPLLEVEATGRRYRLIGIGAADLAPAGPEAQPDLLDADATQKAAVERVMDELRERLGNAAIRKGRGWVSSPLPAVPPPSSKPRRR
jgi:DNA polymerase-4